VRDAGRDRDEVALLQLMRLAARAGAIDPASNATTANERLI
jgi:hypothetical protein